MKQILVTGGAGFIGSNFIRYYLKRHDELRRLVNFDALTYAGNPDNLLSVKDDPRYRFVRGDVRDREAVEELFREYEFDAVVHFAAESHVDRSIQNPGVFASTNVMGTQILLDAALRYWKGEPEGARRRKPEGFRFLQVSTDEVYGALGPEGRFTESSPLAPNSPYSASKAGADLMARAYFVTFGLPVNITRCSNNYGPRQFPEKLVPLMIHHAQKKIPLPVSGDGLQVRDWLFVEDHCAALEAVLERGVPGEVYNIGGDGERTNLEIVRLILRELGKEERLIEYVTDRPGHDRRYAIDHGKITRDIGWKPTTPFERGIRETIDWYGRHTEWTERILSGAYRNFP